MRNSMRFMAIITLILIALCVGIAINDRACAGATQQRHCAD